MNKMKHIKPFVQPDAYGALLQEVSGVIPRTFKLDDVLNDKI